MLGVISQPVQPHFSHSKWVLRISVTSNLHNGSPGDVVLNLQEDNIDSKQWIVNSRQKTVDCRR